MAGVFLPDFEFALLGLAQLSLGIGPSGLCKALCAESIRCRLHTTATDCRKIVAEEGACLCGSPLQSIRSKLPYAAFWRRELGEGGQDLFLGVRLTYVVRNFNILTVWERNIIGHLGSVH